MSRKRMSLKKIMEILRLKKGEGRSNRDVANSVICSPSKVCDVVARFKASGLSWPLPSDMTEEALESKLYSGHHGQHESYKTPLDLPHIHSELRRKGVTLYLLWEEYKKQYGDDGVEYSRYCDIYRRYRQKLNVTMRQVHKAGDKAFVDWSGDGIDIVDRETGEVSEAPLFVGVLGASGSKVRVSKTPKVSTTPNRKMCKIPIGPDDSPSNIRREGRGQHDFQDRLVSTTSFAVYLTK